jgi:hypothetical protein
MMDQTPKLETAEDQAVHHAWTPEGEVAPAPKGVDEDEVIGAIATVYDPEIPVNIYELGLIYAVDIADDGKIKVEMTLTAGVAGDGARGRSGAAGCHGLRGGDRLGSALGHEPDE